MDRKLFVCLFVYFFLQSVVGLDSFHHRKVGKTSELTLVWTAEDREKAPVEQVRTAKARK